MKLSISDLLCCCVFLFFGGIIFSQDPSLSVPGVRPSNYSDFVFGVKKEKLQGKFRDYEGWAGEFENPSAQKTNSESKSSVDGMPEKNTIGDQYFVVVGSFGNKNNADNYHQKIKKEGYDQTLLLFNKEKNIYQVCLFKTTLANEAEEILLSYSEGGKKAWILELKN
ncbi:MAG: SPOR domain-containing protein [Bacteroidetes bacterium]|nr:SPOR domain-containing protein [Bacteroidota bacterium]